MNANIHAKSRIFLTAFLLLFGCSVSAYASSWDFEYWQYLNWKNWEHGRCKLYTVGEMRMNKEASQFYYYRVTENFAYQALPCLDLEAHYSFVHHKSRGALHFTNTSRLEFEATSSMFLNHGIAIKWRNRIEFLKKENISNIEFVFRHRIMASIPIECCGKLTSINLYDEIFYDFNNNKITQNRFVPIEMSFTLDRHFSCEVFFMIRNFFSFSADKWYRSIVLGSQLNF